MGRIRDLRCKTSVQWLCSINSARSIRLPDDFDEDDNVIDILSQFKIMAMYDTGSLDLSVPLPTPREDRGSDGDDARR